MFLNYLKSAVAKKNVKKRLGDPVLGTSGDRIRTIGIITDDLDLVQLQQLSANIASSGFDAAAIRTLTFVARPQKESAFPVFSARDMGWNGAIRSEAATSFLSTPFDLLINFYDQERSALVAATQASAARFKVGFASVDKKLNHLLIDSNTSQPDVFISELFRYLKILNRI